MFKMFQICWQIIQFEEANVCQKGEKPCKTLISQLIPILSYRIPGLLSYHSERHQTSRGLTSLPLTTEIKRMNNTNWTSASHSSICYGQDLRQFTHKEQNKDLKIVAQNLLSPEHLENLAKRSTHPRRQPSGETRWHMHPEKSHRLSSQPKPPPFSMRAPKYQLQNWKLHMTLLKLPN